MHARFIFGVVFAAATVALAAQVKPGTPQAAIVALLDAIYANDVAAYERVTLQHPHRSKLTQSGRRNDDRLKDLRRDPGGLQIRIQRAFQLKGRDVQPDAAGQYPIGTTARFLAAHGGSPMVVSVVKLSDGWKVDLRWWIAMTELSGSEPPRSSPDYAIKNLLLAMLGLNKIAAARFVVADAKMDVLWAGAPGYREPSGVLEASVVEMPLIEIGAGEFVELPSGRVVEGAASPDRKVIVGLFGPTEIGFVVRRAGDGWRVEVEPYFRPLNR
jgi:hypothetical protein